MDNNERRAGLVAILRLTQDAATCLNQALAEVKLRAIPGTSWAIGALGTAHAATQFAVRMLTAAADRPPPQLTQGKPS